MTRLICVRGLTMFELCVFVVDDKYPHTPTRKQHTWTGRLQELTRKGENIDRPELFEGGVQNKVGRTTWSARTRKASDVKLPTEATYPSTSKRTNISRLGRHLGAKSISDHGWTTISFSVRFDDGSLR